MELTIILKNDISRISQIGRFRLHKSCWLVKVINTAIENEALIWSMYINYFDDTVCVGESVLHFEKAGKLKSHLNADLNGACCISGKSNTRNENKI